MKKLLLLMTALLMGVSGAWADDVTVTVTTDSKNWSEYGSWVSYTSSSWGHSWLSKDNFVVVNSTGHTGYVNRTAPTVMASTNYDIIAYGGSKITGYSITFYSNTSGTESKISGSNKEAKTSNTTADGAVTFSVDDLNVSSTAFTVSGAWAKVVEFTITLDNAPTRITSVSSFSNNKCYNILNNRAIWTVDDAVDASALCSTYDSQQFANFSNTKQQFAFLYYDDDYDDDFDGYYLYSVERNKFGYVDGTKLSLSDLSTYNSPRPSKVTFATSTNTTWNSTYPTVIQLDENSYGVSTGKTPDIFKWTPYLDDDGNASAIYEAGTFTPTTALSTLESFMYPELESGETYTFYINNSTTPYYLSTATSSDAVKLVVTENGTNNEGRKVYSLMNASTGKYLSYSSASTSVGTSNQSAARLTWEDNATNSKYLISNAFNGKVAIRPAAAANNNYLTAWSNSAGQNLVLWNDGNTAISYWTMTKEGKTITYNLKWNGETIKTSKVYAVEEGTGTATIVPWTAPAYCNFTYDVATIAANTTTVNVTLNWDGPFEISEDYDNAIWYLMSVGGKYAYYTSGTKVQLESTYLAAYTEDNDALWAFVGNPYSGIQVMNKNAGSTKYVVGYNYPIPDALSTDQHVLYSKYSCIETSSGFGLYNDGFYIGFDEDAACLQMKQASTDNAVIQMEVLPYYSVKAINDLTTYASNNAVGEYFGVLQSIIDGTISDLENGTIQYLTEEDYTSEFINDFLPNVIVPNIKYPATGYYRIKNYVEQTKYLNGKHEDNGEFLEWSTDNTSASTVVKITNNSNKNYYLQVQGLYVQTPEANQGVTLGKSPVAFSATVRDGEPGWVSLNAGGDTNGNLNLRESWDAITGYEAATGNIRSFWKIEDATSVTIPLSGAIEGKFYATFSAPFPVTIGDNAKAYTVKLNGDRAVYSEIESKQIPAGAGILLISETAAANVTATISATDFGALENNDLVGYYLSQTFSYDTSTSGTWYLGLGNHATSGIGFYQISSATGANKAYLPYAYTTGESVRGFVLVAGDDPTGINTTINADTAAKNYFDLSGRRVSKPTQGVYILNGKKVLVK